MREDYSSRVSADFQPSLHYILNQLLPNQSKHSTELTPDADLLRSEPRARRTALVVDDVADVTEMLAVVLSHAGYSVVTAASAPAALNAARER